VAEGVEVVRVVGRKSDRESQNRRRDGTDPCPALTPSHAICDQEQHRQTGCGDEPRNGDLQMTDVLVERRAELLDLVLPDFTSFGPMPSSRKLSVKLRMKKITAYPMNPTAARPMSQEPHRSHGSS
jgi:hypothetical protein